MGGVETRVFDCTGSGGVGGHVRGVGMRVPVLTASMGGVGERASAFVFVGSLVRREGAAGARGIAASSVLSKTGFPCSSLIDSIIFTLREEKKERV